MGRKPNRVIRDQYITLSYCQSHKNGIQCTALDVEDLASLPKDDIGDRWHDSEGSITQLSYSEARFHLTEQHSFVIQAYFN